MSAVSVTVVFLAVQIWVICASYQGWWPEGVGRAYLNGIVPPVVCFSVCIGIMVYGIMGLE